HLPNGHIVPALIAGNAVVFKPSEKTPATGALLVQCFHAAGIPEGVVRLLIGGPDQGRALASEPGIDGLLFTGSARAGMAIHKQFAETPHKILALELGGNNPLVVWAAKDIEPAAMIAVQSAYLTPALIDVTDVRDRPDEEIFGPVLQVIRVKDFDAAIEEANNTRFGLAASLVGGSPELYDKFWANVRAGVINWNKPTNGAPSN